MSAEQQPLKVMVYSDDHNTRNDIRVALGRWVAADLPEITTVDFATAPAVVRALDNETFDALVFDGEAVPAGGMGLSYQLHDEVANCPPILVLVARQDDAWLAAWSRAEAVTGLPVDPTTLPGIFAEMVRKHRAGAPADGEFATPVTHA
ncbi:response regulator [Propionibacteriaceae bacterium G1746]|uniref:response regulator n=1 Tax=Aestuariimicrobium sp. G57 TaxID=3418485 RepID=UPI003C19F581